MKFRLITSLLLVAVLAALYLGLADADAQQQPAPTAAPATTTDQGATPGLGRIKIF